MADDFNLETSENYLMPSPKAAIVTFSLAVGEKRSIHDIWIVNTTNTNRWVSLWFDYDSTNSGDTEKYWHEVDVPKNDFIHITGIPTFQNGGRITAECEVDGACTMHLHMGTQS